MGREDIRRIRRKLRWFTFIVVVLAGLNSYFNTSIAEQGGINATGLGGAFATAFFVFLTILIFISIPFNVLAFFVVRSNRYSVQDFRRISRVLIVFTVIVSLLVAVYSYFGGFVAGSTTLKGAGSVIYAVIFTVIVMIIVVAIPVHVLAFLFFVIRGPREGVQNPPRWTKKYEKAFAHPTSPDIRTLFVGQDQPDWKERVHQFFHSVNKYSLAASIALAFISDSVPEREAKELALKYSKKLSTASRASRDLGKAWNRIIGRKPEPEEAQKEREIEAFRRFNALRQNILSEQQKQKQS